MQRSRRQRRIWEVGGLVALLTVTTASAALLVRSQLLNRALASALENGDDDRMLELVRQGADINTRDRLSRWTPLMRAALGANGTVVRELIERGARVNSTSRGGATALMYLCWAGDLPTVELLLSKGADPHVKDRLGQGPLSCAVQGGQDVVARVLVTQGCDPCAKDLSGNDAISIARLRSDWEMARLLIQLDRGLHARKRASNLPR